MIWGYHYYSETSICSSCSSSWGQYISEPVVESAYNAVTGRTAKFFGRIFRWWDDGMVGGLDEKQIWKKTLDFDETLSWFWTFWRKKKGNKFKLAATRIWSCSQWASRSILFLWGRSFRNKKLPPPPPGEEKAQKSWRSKGSRRRSETCCQKFNRQTWTLHWSTRFVETKSTFFIFGVETIAKGLEQSAYHRESQREKHNVEHFEVTLCRLKPWIICHKLNWLVANWDRSWMKMYDAHNI